MVQSYVDKQRLIRIILIYMAIDVSVIIVNYKTKRLIRDCIDSIRKLTIKVNYEIIVVDNASEDIAELRSVDVIVLQLEQNVGFGRANNAGVEIASGDVLFFLNPDTVLINNAIKILYNALKSIPGCGACGGNLYNAQMQPAHSYFYCTMSMKHALRCAVKSSDRIRHISNQHNFSESYKKVDYITGADLMIRKELFEKIGGFNSDIFMYYEDVDLCKKVRSQGYKCCVVPQAKIQHLEGQSFKPTEEKMEEIKKRKSHMSGDSVAVFLKSNYNKLHYKSILNTNIIVLKTKQLVYRILSKQTKGITQQLEYFNYIKSKI